MESMEINPVSLPGSWVTEFESGQSIVISDFIGSNVESPVARRG
jgi:hypothetical protein